MTDTALPQESLGVGAILGDAFSTVFAHFGKLAPIAIVPAIAGVFLNALLMGPASLNTTLAITDPAAITGANAPDPVMNLLAMIVGFALWGFAAAALTRAVYDVKLEGRADFNTAISAGLKLFAIAAVLVVIAIIVGSVAAVALILPGLYVAGMWFVIIPAAVIERAGLGALGRSAQLTKGYRWPMVGLTVLFILVLIGLMVIIGVLHFALAGLGGVGLAGTALVSALFAALQYCLGSAVAALAYARLREIKEGASMQSLVEVFR